MQVTQHKYSFSTPRWAADLWLAGAFGTARSACREFCDREGLCVTVTPCEYVYTGGSEPGVRVGVRRYPRFLRSSVALRDIALRLAEHLRAALGQESVMVELPDEVVWMTTRGEDGIGTAKPEA